MCKLFCKTFSTERRKTKDQIQKKKKRRENGNVKKDSKIFPNILMFSKLSKRIVRRKKERKKEQRKKREERDRERREREREREERVKKAK